MIKAIETEYKGYKFRSRLEARWAIFFDAIGVRWEYEPEGFALSDGTYYLPDFLIHDGAGRAEGDLWIEVKGEMQEEDARRIELFARHKPVLTVGNIPYAKDFYGLAQNIADKLDMDPFELTFNFETVCGDYYPAIPVVLNNGRFSLWGIDWDLDKDRKDGVDLKKTLNAYKAARQARFEHGEKPKGRNE